MTTAATTFSIITVVRNDAKNLLATIENVSEQTYGNIEFIVIDGGSTDDTLSVIKMNVNRITTWISETDTGIYDAMNKGVKYATGNYVNFLNAGDKFADPDVLERVATKIKDTDADIVYGRSYHKNVNGEGGYLKGSKITNRSLIRTVPFCHQTLFTKRDLFNEVGDFDLSYPIVADYDWVIRYYKRRSIGKMHFMSETIVEYDAGGFSFKNIARSVTERKRLTDLHFKGKYQVQRNFNFMVDSLRVWVVSRLSDSAIIHHYRKLKYGYRRSAIR